MNIKDYHNIYMSGIGGISMSGIAEILKNWGFIVNGSDAAISEQTEHLESIGVHVDIGQVSNNIKEDIDLFIYSAAIHEDNPEYIRAKELNIPMIERGAFLGELTKLYKDTIGIAGTHGKTSTTGMVSEIFLHGNMDPSIQIGAIMKNIEANYRVGNSDYFIIEACEYHNSFLNFKQRSAIVLNIDDDHMDFFKTMDNVVKSYKEYVSMLPNDGFLVINRDDDRCYSLKDSTKAKVITVGTNNNADWHYEDVSFNEDGYPTYKAFKGNNLYAEVVLQVTGLHNVFNSLCAIALGDAYGIDKNTIVEALSKFSGNSRRMEFKGYFCGAKVYDDYGHHPTEILATYKAIKNKKYNECWVVFEPHTFSRLYEHLNQFAEVLVNFDHIIITNIYAAREVNTYNIKVEDLQKLLKKESIHISSHDEIVKYLKEHVHENDIILTLGAGNVTKIAKKLIEAK